MSKLLTLLIFGCVCAGANAQVYVSSSMGATMNMKADLSLTAAGNSTDVGHVEIEGDVKYDVELGYNFKDAGFIRSFYFEYSEHENEINVNTDLGAILGFTSAELDQEYYLFGLRLGPKESNGLSDILPYITIGLGSLDADLRTNLGSGDESVKVLKTGLGHTYDAGEGFSIFTEYNYVYTWGLDIDTSALTGYAIDTITGKMTYHMLSIGFALEL